MPPPTSIATRARYQQNLARVQQAILNVALRDSSGHIISALFNLANNFSFVRSLLYLFSLVTNPIAYLQRPAQLRYWIKNLFVAALIIFIVLHVPPIIYREEIRKASILSTYEKPESNLINEESSDQFSTDRSAFTKKGPAITDLMKPAAIEEHCHACGPHSLTAPWNSGSLAMNCDLYAVLGLDTPLSKAQVSVQWQYTDKQIHSAAARRLERLERDSRQSRTTFMQQAPEGSSVDRINYSPDTKSLAAVVLRARRILEDPALRATYDHEVLARFNREGTATEDMCRCSVLQRRM